MSMTEDFTEAETAVLEKVEKLMRLAARNTSAEEAASATAKAQELLIAYNLSADDVGRAGRSTEGRREERALRGGMYQWQRSLWRQVAQLNFCMYWVIEHTVVRDLRRRGLDGTMQNHSVLGKEFHHTFVGRRINVMATIQMGEYLQGAIERLTRERFPQNSQRFMREAIAFREGVADTVYWKLADRRRSLKEAERRRAAEAAARSGVSTAQALTIGSLEQQERDANLDHMYGEGWSARQREERAQRAEASRRAEEEYTRWAAANPEEAARAERKRRAEQRRAEQRAARPRSRAPTAQERRSSSGTYWQGRDAGEAISIDPQVDRSEGQRRLT